MVTTVLRRSLWEISSTIRNAQAKLSTFPWKSAVSRLTRPFRQTSPLRLLNGRSSMLIWLHTKRSRELNLRSSKRIKRIRDQFNRLLQLSKILFTLPQWSVPSRLWNVWSFKTLTMRSSMITDTIQNLLKTHQDLLIAPCSHFGVSQLRDLVRSM
jgi:hypothetical protein